MDTDQTRRTPPPDDIPVEGSPSAQMSKPQPSKRRRRAIISHESIFHYKPLDRSHGAVRLIRVFALRPDDFVRCRIERHHISTAKYVALSYVWGDQEAKCEILLNGQLFMVRSNLFAFLRYLAKTGYFTDTLFWIDAICIDQNNVTEKNHHISHMGTIYRRASKVISWLGNSACYASSGMDPPGQWLCCEAFTTDKDAGRRHRCEWRVPYSSSWTLLRHEYWSRLWVAQELSLAQRVDILYRGRFYSWSQITRCLGRNMLSFQEHHQRPAPLSSLFAENMRYLGDLPVARYLKPSDSAPLGDLVPRFASHKCQVGHDHAFALLSIASDGKQFEPDYDEQCISLLFRLMTFFRTSPTTSFISKIGMALGLRPSSIGIPLNFAGHPVISETVGTAATYFRLVDRVSDSLEGTDIVAQIPDTNLFILCRRQQRDGEHILYTVLARVYAVSLRVEQGRRKFTNKNRNTAMRPTSTTSLSESSAWDNVLVKRDGTNNFRLYCDWQTVLFVFDNSKTLSTPGRLESRIREWNLPFDTSPEDGRTFLVSKGTTQKDNGENTII